MILRPHLLRIASKLISILADRRYRADSTGSKPSTPITKRKSLTFRTPLLSSRVVKSFRRSAQKININSRASSEANSNLLISFLSKGWNLCQNKHKPDIDTSNVLMDTFYYVVNIARRTIVLLAFFCMFCWKFDNSWNSKIYLPAFFDGRWVSRRCQNEARKGTEKKTRKCVFYFANHLP